MNASAAATATTAAAFPSSQQGLPRFRSAAEPKASSGGKGGGGRGGGGTAAAAPSQPPGRLRGSCAGPRGGDTGTAARAMVSNYSEGEGEAGRGGVGVATITAVTMTSTSYFSFATVVASAATAAAAPAIGIPGEWRERKSGVAGVGRGETSRPAQRLHFRLIGSNATCPPRSWTSCAKHCLFLVLCRFLPHF
jgi:hypothetical protein